MHADNSNAPCQCIPYQDTFNSLGASTVSPHEAESYVEQLREISMDDFGSDKYVTYHGSGWKCISEVVSSTDGHVNTSTWRP
jgi:hypothetical protein